MYIETINAFFLFSLIFWLSLSPFTLVYHSLCTCCLYGAGRMDLDAGKTITWAVWRGGPWKSRLFLGPEMRQRAQRVPWGAVRYEFITYHLGGGGIITYHSPILTEQFSNRQRQRSVHKIGLRSIKIFTSAWWILSTRLPQIWSPSSGLNPPPSL